MNKSIVLLFHSIDDRNLDSFQNLGNIHLELFRKFLSVLRKEYDIVSLEDVVSSVSGTGKKGERLLALTFDDGTKSYATSAVPIMESLQIPSTCFLITDCIGDRAIYWRYLFNVCMHRNRGSELAGLVNKEYGSSIQEKEVIGYTRSNFNVLKNRNIIRGIFRSIISEEEYRAQEGNLFLSFDDIEMLKHNPLVTFGIHTRTHPVMMKLSDDEIKDEISGSLYFYRKHIHESIPMFSIPFGRLYQDYDERTIKTAQQLSIEHIFSAYGGINTKEQPLYNIRRISVHSGMLEQGIHSSVNQLEAESLAEEYCEGEKRLAHALEQVRSKEHPSTSSG